MVNHHLSFQSKYGPSLKKEEIKGLGGTGETSELGLHLDLSIWSAYSAGILWVGNRLKLPRGV